MLDILDQVCADNQLCLLLHLQATSQLSSALRMEASSMSDSASQTKLLNAAKLLADATARLVDAAKVRLLIQQCAYASAN